MTGVRAGNTNGNRPGYAAWLAADVVLIAFFALLGHLSHYGSLSGSGIMSTALPFLGAYAAVTAILRPWRQPAALLRVAIPLWIGTAAGGLVLRVLLGESAALSFQIVAVCTLGLFLFAPRAVAALMRRRRPRPTVPHSPSPNQGAAT
jgi:hypothetical protein